ncbi:MAG: Asp-tRNA(Asn)/Glu-tRNA(Gln) amidotransferase GatCAB subunit B [Desulfobacter postgatei]|uniref:Aspartyl/glutamyl-tRNA(Asn/Gln) amidotransferase subunit B n=1 Tax=Desulfobacter postgatei TaxID=2293 RepID=A0A2G6MRZ8_9BACT|nr:MAG: Asp-tRNA(Asn)/Glu-tRNA(Gln) amidotransferase GatCAB subunit B [Desulfobacter postgatei]
MAFEPVIGLEVHAQLKTETKIFCNCSTAFGKSPNANTCPVCTGMPGVLPVLNKQAVTFAIKAGLATNCTINRESRFDRKNYFYPDLPKGYQISQFAMPIAEHGFLDIDADETEKRIGITRIHMEEDAGKLIHDPVLGKSLVDLNRTGVPLIEIVSEPDLRSAAQAGAYLRKLHAILKYIDVCDGNMEQGSFRCDANISLRPVGQKAFGIRTELKNLNSFKNVEKAILYEIQRQTYVLEEGKQVIQETRLWDPSKNRTASMRGKEEAHDYRYFPDPDLVPLIVDDAWIQEVRSQMPELPDEKKQRFIQEYSLSEYDAGVLTASLDMANFFEQTIKPLKNIKQAANWTMTTLMGMLNTRGIEINESPLSAQVFSKLLGLLESSRINANAAKIVFEEMVDTGKDPESIVKEKGLEQVSDQGELETMVDEIIKENPKEVQAYREGKTKLFSFFMGQVMKKTRGKADPKVVTPMLKSKL